MINDESEMESEAVEENEDEGGAEGDEEEGGNALSPLVLIGGVVAVLLVAGAALYFTGMLDGLLGQEVTQEEGEHAEGDGHGGDDHGSGDHGGGHGGGHGGEGAMLNFLEIPPMLVNLSSDDGSPRYLRLSVQLELYSPGDRGAVEAVIPRVVDQFQTYLRELRIKDLRGSAGIYRLQMELLWRVNQASAPVKVKDVLFQEILIQ